MPLFPRGYSWRSISCHAAFQSCSATLHGGYHYKKKKNTAFRILEGKIKYFFQGRALLTLTLPASNVPSVQFCPRPSDLQATTQE